MVRSTLCHHTAYVYSIVLRVCEPLSTTCPHSSRVHISGGHSIQDLGYYLQKKKDEGCLDRHRYVGFCTTIPYHGHQAHSFVRRVLVEQTAKKCVFLTIVVTLLNYMYSICKQPEARSQRSGGIVLCCVVYGCASVVYECTSYQGSPNNNVTGSCAS